MSPMPARVFHYHACAQAFSANFTRPFHHQIDVQAQSALPITGGHGHSRVDDFEFCEFIKFKHGHSHVSGGHQADDDTNNTLATSVLEHLNMFNVLTADRIVSRLYSKHQANAREGDITWLGSRIDNLQIGGIPIHLELNLPLLNMIPTFEKAYTAFKDGGDFKNAAKDPFGAKHDLDIKDINGVFLCSIFKQITVEHDSEDIKPVGTHGLYVRGFGTVFFGELLVKHAEKTLTMLRFNLGSTTSGSGSGGGSRTNGTGYP